MWSPRTWPTSTTRPTASRSTCRTPRVLQRRELALADWQQYGTVRRQGNVTLDANGNGEVDFDVQHANQKWDLATVKASTNQAQTTAPYPQVTLYTGGQQAGLAEGASWVGNQVTLRGSIIMADGDPLSVVFAGGVAGSVATVIIEGDAYRWA